MGISEDQKVLMTQGEISKMLGVASQTIAEWSRDAVLDFPAPLRIGPNQSTATKMWRRTDIESWLAGLEGIRNVPFPGGPPPKKKEMGGKTL